MRDKTFIAAAVGVSIAALAGFWLGAKDFKNQVLAGEAIEEGRNWAVYLGHNLPRLPTIVGKKKPQDNERRIIESARRAAGIVHFRFLATDGRIIYSSVLKEVGKNVADDTFAGAVAGRIVVGAVTNGVDASGAAAIFRTAYVPILDKNKIAGVIEVSSDVTARAARLDRLVLFATIGMAAVMLLIIVLMAMAKRGRIPPVALVRPHLQTAAPPPRPDSTAVTQAISRVLALIRLEMRTPLSGINAMANQLRASGAAENFPALAGALYRTSSALINLVDTITDPSPPVFDDPVPFKLKEVVADAIDLLATPAEGKRLQLIDVVSDRVPPAVLGDPGMLTQLLICAVTHGIDMVNGGNLLVEVDCGSDAGTSDAVEFALSFSGSSDPRANPAADASVLRRLVTRLGGEVIADGSDGRLPRFILALPSAGEIPYEEPVPPPSAQAPSPAPPPAPTMADPFQNPVEAFDAPPAPSMEESDQTPMDAFDAPPPPPAGSNPEFAAIDAPTLDMSTLEALRDEQNGRPGLVERVIANYLEQSPVSLKKLADGVQRGNAPLVQMAANRLKTSSANIGAARLAELCEGMEHLARTSQVDRAEPLMSEIVTEYTKVEDALDAEAPPEAYSQSGL